MKIKVLVFLMVAASAITPSMAASQTVVNARWETRLDTGQSNLGQITGFNLDIGLGPRSLSLHGFLELSNARSLAATGTGYMTSDNVYYFLLYAGFYMARLMLDPGNLNGTLELYRLSGEFLGQANVTFSG